MKPALRPGRPYFSSGPCAKHPGWRVEGLSDACLGRSHRSETGKRKLTEALRQTRAILGLPEEYRLGITPASDTGAFEAAMWALLGARGVDCLAWENFGRGWLADAVQELKLPDVRGLTAEYGELPDLGQVDPARDTVFVWNGTTSGVRVPDGEWIARDRSGLTLCDATSAAFALGLPWEKLDVTTFSWQKVLGGEAQHGMLVLSPRAVERLESYRPPWPIPKVLRLTKGGRLNGDIFSGGATNTPSLLCVEDYLETLRWAKAVGGLEGLIARCERNCAALARWVDATWWVEPLAVRPETRSTTSVCLKVVDPWFPGLSLEARWMFIRSLTGILEVEGVAYDIAAYREAPPGLRIWCGATVETADIEALTPWLDWAYEVARAR